MNRTGRGILRNALFAGGYLLLHAITLAIGASSLAAAWPGWPGWLTDALPILARIFLALFSIHLVFVAGNALEGIIERKTENEGVRYNLLRVARLTSFALVAIVVASFLFQNLYAAAVSFGLFSLVLGFALQAPITSFIAWLYIIFRRPYHVGDRIQIGNLRGDVIEISYLETVLKESRGPYAGNNRQSSRTVRIPNSLVLKTEVINYRAPGDDFLWNETAIQIAWSSDLAFVEACLRRAADEDFAGRHSLAAGRADNASLVYFRNNQNAWLEAVVSYPVEPNDTTERRSRILCSVLPMLQAEPEKAQLPEGSRR